MERGFFMPRTARIIVPHVPHHIVQRGNNRQNVFWEREDFLKYCGWMNRYAGQYRVDILAYCLMINHVHFIAEPEDETGLSRLLNTLHMRYAQYQNAKRNRSGHLWQGRFVSYPMDRDWLLQAAAYVELDPVKAGMVKRAWDYRWSSVHAHLSGVDRQDIIQPEKLQSLTGDWKEYLLNAHRQLNAEFERHEKTGRPLGKDSLIEKAERFLGRDLKKKMPGPKTDSVKK